MKLHGLDIPTKSRKSEISTPTAKGSCLCGVVRYSVHAPLDKNVRPCHCTQCRKQSGHYAAHVQVERWDRVRIKGEDNISWYRASNLAKRGFCKTCGSHLFWVPNPETSDRVSGGVTSGTLDQPTNVKFSAHTFVADKGDYYDITDDLPQHDAYPVER
jgi:hypothetical protein